MRILLLSFYYPPDLSAGSFRATALVDALLEAAPPGSTVELMTTVPNRYHSFAVDAPQHEQRGALHITRIPLGRHRSGKVDQGFAALSYFAGAVRAARGRAYDVVAATSGRLMTAATGAFISRITRAPLYLDIRDIFADLSREILPAPLAAVLSPTFSAIEKWTMSRASHVNLVSRGFEPYFRRRYPGQKFTFLTNGVDQEFIDAAPTSATPEKPRDATVNVLYAGNLGESQGLEFIVPPLARRLGSRVRFVLVGDGGRRATLERAVAEQGLANVTIRPPVKRAELLEAYRTADVLFLHLNDYEAFRTVLPSKLFEYGALGKPVWAGVAGYTAEFVRTEISNSAVFAPRDVDGAIRAFEALRIHDAPRQAFVRKFDRKTISRAMARDIIAVAEGRAGAARS